MKATIWATLEQAHGHIGMAWHFEVLDLHATSWFAVKSVFGLDRDDFSKMFLSSPAKLQPNLSQDLTETNP